MSQSAEIGRGIQYRTYPEGTLSCNSKTLGCAVLIISSLGALAAIGVGLGALGAQAGWWHSETLSQLTQLNAIIMMTSGGAGAAVVLLASSVVFCVKNFYGERSDANISSKPTFISNEGMKTSTSQKNSNNSIDSVRATFSELNIIGKEKWKQYLDLDAEIPPVPQHIVEYLTSDNQTAETHTLLLIPKSLNIGKLIDSAKKPKMGTRVEINVSGPLNNIYNRHTVENSYWILITKSPIKGTEEQSYVRQEKILQDSGHVLPYFYEALAFLSMVYVTSGKKALGNQNIYCDGTFEGKHIAIGWPNGMLATLFDQISSSAAFGVKR